MKLQIAVSRFDETKLVTEQVASFSVDEDTLTDVAFQRFPDVAALEAVQMALSTGIKQAYERLGSEVVKEGQLRKDAAAARKKFEDEMAAVDPDVLPQELNTPEKRTEWLKARGEHRFNLNG